MSKKSINIKLAALGHPVEVEKGEGYIYFIYDTLDNGGRFETYTTLTPYLNDYTEKQWVEMAIEFSEAVAEDRYDSGQGLIRSRV